MSTAGKDLLTVDSVSLTAALAVTATGGPIRVSTHRRAGPQGAVMMMMMMVSSAMGRDRTHGRDVSMRRFCIVRSYDTTGKGRMQAYVLTCCES